MSNSRRNKRKTSRKSNHIGQTPIDRRTIEMMMERNEELLNEMLENVHFGNYDTPYRMVPIGVKSPALGINLQAHLYYKANAESKCERFIRSELVSITIKHMVEERLSGNVEENGLQILALPHWEFLGIIMLEEDDEESFDGNSSTIDFPIGPLSMN
jgi:hypothetical protein